MVYSLMVPICWAFTGIFVKSVSINNSLHIVFIRSFISVFILVAAYLFLKKRHLMIFDTPSFKNIINISILSSLMSLYYAFATMAFSFSSVSLVSLILSTPPIITALLQYFINKEINRYEAGGVFISSIFMILFIKYSSASESVSTDNERGVILSLIAAISLSIFSVLSWKLRESGTVFHPLHISLMTMIILTCTLCPINEFYELFDNLSIKDSSIFFILALMCTTLPTLLNAKASVMIEPMIHAMINTTTPLFASFLAFFLLGEPLSVSQMICVFGVLSGIFLVIICKRRMG